MFAYCRNNPVGRRDVSGYEDEKVQDDGTTEVNPDDKELGTGAFGGGGKGGFDPYQAALDSNSYPNPYGRHGGPAHTGLIDSLRLLFEELSFDVSPNEKKVLIPREDKYRYPDLTVDTGKEIIYVQVGKSKANGDPIAREKRAIDDLGKTGNMVWFFPYDD